MTALDWVLLLIVAGSGLLGLLRGMIGVVMSLVAWLLAGLAAYLFGGDVGRSLVTDGQLGWGEYLGGYALSFAIVWIAVTLIGLVVRRLAHAADCRAWIACSASGWEWCAACSSRARCC